MQVGALGQPKLAVAAAALKTRRSTVVARRGQREAGRRRKSAALRSRPAAAKRSSRRYTVTRLTCTPAASGPQPPRARSARPERQVQRAQSAE